MVIRETTHSDIPALQTVLEETGLFPATMLPDLLAGFLADTAVPQLWLSAVDDDASIGFCYAVEELLAPGSWNMLAIAVCPSRQGRGAGAALVRTLEQRLGRRDGRILIADTSGTDAFGGTRAFYRKAGYAEEARIRDFWAPGDDKVVFWKALTK